MTDNEHATIEQIQKFIDDCEDVDVLQELADTIESRLESLDDEGESEEDE